MKKSAKKHLPQPAARKSQSRQQSDAASGPRRYRIFISHATYDKFLARMICEKSEGLAAGISTFRDDRDIQGGDTIPEEIKAAIRNSDEVAVILTPQSINRQGVLLEIGMVECRIVPLMYHVEPANIPQIVQSRRGYSLDQIDDYLADLQSRVQKVSQ